MWQDLPGSPLLLPEGGLASGVRVGLTHQTSSRASGTVPTPSPNPTPTPTPTRTPTPSPNHREGERLQHGAVEVAAQRGRRVEG